jgi:hypothetical protein
VTYTPDDVPADTDRYVYRYVTKPVVNDSGVPVIESVLTQIWISQP